MATKTISASLRYWSGSWKAGEARQGVNAGGVRERGEMTFDFSSLGDLTNVNITAAKLSIHVGAIGGAYTKTLYLKTGSYNGTAVGEYSFTGCYNADKSLTFSASSHSAGLSALKTYIEAGPASGRVVLGIYAASSRGSGTYDWDWLSITAATLELTYTYKKSVGSIGSATTGSTTTLAITAYSSAYSHRVTWTLGSWRSGPTAVAAGVSSATVTIPHSALPSTTSGTASVTLETLDAGGSSLGSNTYSFTANVPSSVIPRITAFTAAPACNTSSGRRRISATAAGWGKYIQHYSWATLSLAADNGDNGSNGTDIASWTISAAGATIYSTSGSLPGTVTAVTDWLERAGSVTFTAAVTDDRGRTSTGTVTITVQAYAAPSVTGATAYRCDSAGTKDILAGTYAWFKATLGCSSVDGQNSLTTKTVKINNVTTAIASDTWYKLGAGALSVDTTYPAEITLVDAVGVESKFTVPVPSANYVMHVRKGGKSLGLGRAAGTVNSVINVGWGIDADSWIQARENFWRKEINVDASESDNNVSTNVYPGYAISDADDRALARFLAGVYTDGTVSAGMTTRNYDALGQLVAEAGLWVDMDKSGNVAYRMTSPSAFRTALGLKYEDVTQGNKTIGSDGYVALTKPATGTPIMAMVKTWSTMSGGTTALAVAGSTNWYLTGTAGVTVNGLVVRYLYIG